MNCPAKTTTATTTQRAANTKQPANRKQLAAKRITPELVKRFQVISLSEVCRQLNISRPTAYRLVRAGELEILTEDGAHWPSGNPVRVMQQVCVTLQSWNAYRRRHGIA